MDTNNKTPEYNDTKDIIVDIFENKQKRNIFKDNTENKPVDEINKKWDMNDKIIDLFAETIKKDIFLKKVYAIILIIILALMLGALVTIFILKGLNILNYSDTTFNIFITAGIAEVFVLVKIIVEYLFKDNLSNALTIILKNNNPTKNDGIKNNKNKK